MKNKQIVLFGATLALVLALVFWFAMPAYKFVIDLGVLGKTTTNFNFADATFGTSTTIGGTTITGFKFSVLNLLPLVLLILGLVLVILKVLDIKLFANKNFDTLLIAVFSLLAGIGFLLVIVFTGMTNDVDMDGFTLGMGAILAGALSIVGGLLTFASKSVK